MPEDTTKSAELLPAIRARKAERRALEKGDVSELAAARRELCSSWVEIGDWDRFERSLASAEDLISRLPPEDWGQHRCGLLLLRADAALDRSQFVEALRLSEALEKECPDVELRWLNSFKALAMVELGLMVRAEPLLTDLRGGADVAGLRAACALMRHCAVLGDARPAREQAALLLDFARRTEAGPRRSVDLALLVARTTAGDPDLVERAVSLAERIAGGRVLAAEELLDCDPEERSLVEETRDRLLAEWRGISEFRLGACLVGDGKDADKAPPAGR